jgi:hypothetical protein
MSVTTPAAARCRACRAEARAAHGGQQAARERRHPRRRAEPEQQPRAPGQGPGVRGRAGVEPAERQVGGDHDQAREQGGYRGGEEAAVGLERGGEHDRDAVERDLR